jgi:ferredoxin
MSGDQMRVDWPACKAHGVCAELLPEIISLDEWGYPIVHGTVNSEVAVLAKAAVKACPTLDHSCLAVMPDHSRGDYARGDYARWTSQPDQGCRTVVVGPVSWARRRPVPPCSWRHRRGERAERWWCPVCRVVSPRR